MSNSIKIQAEQVEKIQKLLDDKDFNYRSRNDFVVKAVDNEIRIATLKHRLSGSGKIHFDLLYAESLKNAYEKAVEYDGMYEPESEEYKSREELGNRLKNRGKK